MPTRARTLLACILCVAVLQLQAQTDASVGVGVGTVRVPGGSALGMVLLTPSLRGYSPQRIVSVGGTAALLRGGRPYFQGRVGTWVASPIVGGRWRLAADLDVSGATFQDGGSNGSGQLGVEVLRAGPRWGMGIGAGGAIGAISGSLPVTAWHGRLRTWWQDPAGRTVLAAEVEPTRFLGAWFTDFEATLTWRRSRMTTYLWAAARASDAYGSRGAGTAGAEWRLTHRLALEGSFGRVLPDPYQGLPASVFGTVGVRLSLPRFALARGRIIHTRTLDVSPGKDGLVIRFRRGGAERVSVVGDWNDWVPQDLTPTGRDRWEATLRLRPGVYHFRLLIDGVPWSVPAGVPVVDDGFGDRVAVLTVY